MTTSNFNVYYKPFQSTLPGWGATQIHAVSFLFWAYFNPRSPDGERPGDGSPLPGRSIFQSTLPGWGATNQLLTNPSSQGISIHAPRMGSDQPADAWQHSVSISIHAPRMGSDVSSSILFSFHMYFNPRSPDGERLRVFQRAGRVGHGISIHAPRMGSDGDGAAMAYRADISIHAPRMGSDQQQ